MIPSPAGHCTARLATGKIPELSLRQCSGEIPMLQFVLAAVVWVYVTAGSPAQERKPDKTIELTVKGGLVVFTESGQTNPTTVTAVVGQTVRWVNCDTVPHSISSVATVDGRPVLNVGVIKAGGHKDFRITNDIYRAAGGRPAGAVKIVYHSQSCTDSPAELQLLSAAKR